MKTISKRYFPYLLALAFFAFFPLSAPALMDGAPDAKLAVKWLTPAEEQPLLDLLPPPPQTGSPEDKADLAVVLQAQAGRTPDQIAEDNTDKTFSTALYARVLGDDFTAKNDPMIFALFAKIDSVVGTIQGYAKNKWKRLRPFKAHPEVHAVVGADGFSYPSGHSSHAYAYAIILGNLYPDKKDALLVRADQIAGSRVNSGVHYPSDIAAGKTLGAAIAQALLANKDFMTDLDKARAEATKK